MKNNIKTHWLEFFFGIVFLILAYVLNSKFGFSNDTSWLIAIIGALISLSIVIIKCISAEALGIPKH